jgi:protein-disulfide isomerase
MLAPPVPIRPVVASAAPSPPEVRLPMSRQPTRPNQPLTRRERRAQARLDAPPARTRRTTRGSARPTWQSPLVLVTGAAILIGIAIIAFAKPPAAPSGESLIEPPTSYAADLTDGDVVGSATAPVVLQLYSDFQCPACKQFVTDQLPSLLNDFIRPGMLRIEAHDIDILGRGTPNESLDLAVGAACAAEQDRYWQFHDFVFWNQGRENKGDHNAAFIANVATAAGVDMATWNTCIAKPEVRTAADAASRAAISSGINQTPTLVINGQTQAGVPDYAKLAALIQQLAASAPPASAAPATASPAGS